MAPLRIGMIANDFRPSGTAILGRGRLGRALARALSAAEVPVRLLPGATPLAGLPEPLVFLTIPDDALAARVAALANGPEAGASTVFHTGGLRGAEALHGLASLGHHVGAFHPLQSFPKGDEPPETFRGISIALDGDVEALAAGRGLALLLGAVPIEVPGTLRPLYHLGAALTANGLVGLVGAGRDALVAAGFTDAGARQALAPLLRRSLENALVQGPEVALSGPVSRGDEGTLEVHRRALDAWDPSRKALYEALVDEQRRLCTKRRSS